MDDKPERTELTEEELEEQRAEALPDREVMSLIDPVKGLNHMPPTIAPEPGPGPAV